MMGCILSAFDFNYTFDSLISYMLGYSPFERLLLNASYLDLITSSLTITTSSALRDSIHLIQIENFLNYHFAKQPILSLIYDTSLKLESILGPLKTILKVRNEYDNLTQQFLKQLHHKEQTKQIIIDKSAQPFLANDEDKNKLSELWTNLNDTPIPSKFSITKSEPSKEDGSSWGQIGFQQPFTDFRGAGQLGLANLSYFAKRHTTRAREVLSFSLIPEFWFPFAITGLNITMWLLKFLKENKICIFFFFNEMDPLEIFNTLYCFVFLEFSRFWRFTKPSDIMKFGKVSEEFKAKMTTFFNSLTNLPKKENNTIQITGEILIEEIHCRIDGEVNPHASQILNSSIFF